MKDIGRSGRDTGNNRQGFVDRASNENYVDDDEDYDSDGDFDMTLRIVVTLKIDAGA